MRAIQRYLAVFAVCVLKYADAQSLTITQPMDQQSFFLPRCLSDASPIFSETWSVGEVPGLELGFIYALLPIAGTRTQHNTPYNISIKGYHFSTAYTCWGIWTSRGTGADVPIRYATHGFDLMGDRKICWSIFRQFVSLLSAPFSPFITLNSCSKPQPRPTESPLTQRVVRRISILGAEEAYGTPSCFSNHQELTIRALPKGQYRVLGSLVMEKFWPAYDWQPIHSSQDIPAGMEVREH
eukprot:2534963-Pyramimonas_sp.AAC.1